MKYLLLPLFLFALACQNDTTGSGPADTNAPEGPGMAPSPATPLARVDCRDVSGEGAISKFYMQPVSAGVGVGTNVLVEAFIFRDDPNWPGLQDFCADNVTAVTWSMPARPAWLVSKTAQTATVRPNNAGTLVPIFGVVNTNRRDTSFISGFVR